MSIIPVRIRNRLIHNGSSIQTYIVHCLSAKTSTYLLWWYVFWVCVTTQTSAIETECQQVFAVNFGTKKKHIEINFRPKRMWSSLSYQKFNIFWRVFTGIDRKQKINKNIRHFLERSSAFQSLKSIRIVRIVCCFIVAYFDCV